MAIFGHSQWVREELLINGTQCGHRGPDGESDCETIIQPTGSTAPGPSGEIRQKPVLGYGVQAHWNTVHGGWV